MTRQIEILASPPLQITKPLSLVGDRAYAATWPSAKITENGTVRVKRVLIIIRDDVEQFLIDGDASQNKLGLSVHLPEIPIDNKLWSQQGVKEYFSRQRPDPSDVFQRIIDVIERFIDFDRSLADQRTMAELIACFIMSTWFLVAFSVVGYLWPNGEKGSGKTQLLTIVAELSYLGQLILPFSSTASLRDMSDCGATLCFDDAENVTDKRADPDKRALLLAGNRRGNTVSLKEPNGPRGWKTRHVNTFCARAFSAINTPDPVLGSRSIIVPLIRTCDQNKANAGPSDYSLWPHDRQKVVDNLWALGLGSLREIPEFEKLTNQKARLTGRMLEPWKPVLTVAAWLESKGVNGIWGRMEEMSVAYQQERQELAGNDVIPFLIRALCGSLGCDICDVCDGCDVQYLGKKVFLLTDYIVIRRSQILEEEGADIDPGEFTTRKVGRLLGKLRFEKHRQAGTGSRGWNVTRGHLKTLAISHGLCTPSPTTPLSHVNVTHVTKVTIVTDECEKKVCPEDGSEIG